MGVFGLVNGQWKFFPNIQAAQMAGAINIQKNPGDQKIGPPHPNMYWDEMTGQWRFPQPDGSTPGKMPSIGLPGDEIAPFPPGGGTPFPPGDVLPPPESIAPFPPEYGPPAGPPVGPPGYTPPDGPPGYSPPHDTFTPPQAQPVVGQPGEDFSAYVRNYGDLAAAYKKHKAAGGSGDIHSWGRLHYKKHGQREKRKVPGMTKPVHTAPAPPSVAKPAPDTTPKKPDWGKYLSSNPDLVKAFGTDVGKAKQHWAQFGSKEKRKFTPY